jgi:probable F420-dependent oxidoreductase
MSEARIEVGVLLPTREAVMSGHPDAAPLLLMAEAAETLGFDSVWVGDSLTARPRFEPLTLLGAVAARTRRITLGTAVLLPPLRHPLLLAHAAATLDRIAEGRVVLGVGIAPDSPAVRREYAAAGVPFGERVGRLMESIALCRALWSSGTDPVSVQGRYWTVEGIRILPEPQRPGGPPIWMGGSAPGALRRAGTVADGWFPTAPTPEAFREGWAKVRAHAAEAGRPEAALTPALYATVNANPDPRVAERDMRRFMEDYYAARYEALASWQGCRAGTADDCGEWLLSFVEVGVRHLIVRFGGPDQMVQLERVAALLPRLRAPGPGRISA